MEKFEIPNSDGLDNQGKGRVALELGKRAEHWVYQLCNKYGISCKFATAEQDYAESTDLIVYGKRVQVSLSPKSKRQIRKLIKNGVYPLSVRNKTESDIIEELKQLLN